jgi:hypothetical protein
MNKAWSLHLMHPNKLIKIKIRLIMLITQWEMTNIYRNLEAAKVAVSTKKMEVLKAEIYKA